MMHNLAPQMDLAIKNRFGIDTKTEVTSEELYITKFPSDTSQEIMERATLFIQGFQAGAKSALLYVMEKSGLTC